MGASTGMFGAVWAQAEARKVLGASIMHAKQTSNRVEAAAATARFELGLRVLLDGLVERLRTEPS